MSFLSPYLDRFPSSSGGGGSGTVTNVSITGANGIDASVSDPTTSPTITVGLSAISAATLLGNASAGSDIPSAISLGDGLEFIDGALTNTGGGGGGITDVENIGSGQTLVINPGSSSPIIISSIQDDSAGAGSLSTSINTADSSKTWIIAANYSNSIWNAALLCDIELDYDSINSPTNGYVISYSADDSAYIATALPNPILIKYQVDDVDDETTIISLIGNADESTIVDVRGTDVNITSANGSASITANGTIEITSNTSSVDIFAGDGENISLNLTDDGNLILNGIDELIADRILYYNDSSLAVSYGLKPGIIDSSNDTGSIPQSTSETTLQTLTVPSNVLTQEGQSVTFRMNGTYAAIASSLTINFKIGTTTIVTVPAATLLGNSNSKWYATFTLNYLTSSTYSYEATFIGADSTTVSSIQYYTNGTGTGILVDGVNDLSITAETGLSASISYAAGTTLTLLN